MSSPAMDFKVFLLAQAGLTTDYALEVSREPDAPDLCITLYDTGGADPNPAIKIDWPSLMIRVRGAAGAYAAAYAKAQAIKAALLGLPAQTINGVQYAGLWMRGDINPMGYDQSNRPSFTMNFTLCVEPTAGANRR